MNENVKNFADNLNNLIANSKSREEAMGKPYLELYESDRMYKNIFVISRQWKDTEISIEKESGNYEKKTIKARWGFKVLSKEDKNKMITFAFYFGDVDNNDDWWNKRKGGTIKIPVSKEKFEELVKVMESFANAAPDELTYCLQDYTKFFDKKTQLHYGQATKQMEVKTVKLNKKSMKKLKEWEDKNGNSKRKDNG